MIKPLIKPFVVQRHCLWCNFVIPKKRKEGKRIHNNIVGSEEIYGFDISKEDVDNKRKILRNMVDPKLGLYIFNMAFKNKQEVLTDIMKPKNKSNKGIEPSSA